MKDTYLIVSNADNIVSENLGHIKQTLNQTKTYPPLPNGRKYKIILEYLKIPYSVCNISSAKNNNKITYTYSSTDYTITFPDGIYTPSYLGSYINAYQDTQNHYDTDSYGNKTYYWGLDANNALSRYYILINKTGTEVKDMASTSFNDVIGFSASQYATPITITTLGDSTPNSSQGEDEFYIHFNLAESSFNSAINGSFVLYNSIWNTDTWSYSHHPLQNEKEVSVNLRMLTFTDIDIQIKNIAGNEMVFASDTTIDNITLRFSITDME